MPVESLAGLLGKSFIGFEHLSQKHYELRRRYTPTQKLESK
jgi:hypothetical protein